MFLRTQSGPPSTPDAPGEQLPLLPSGPGGVHRARSPGARRSTLSTRKWRDMAEGQGFEPWVALTTHDFESCAFDLSASPPRDTPAAGVLSSGAGAYPIGLGRTGPAGQFQRRVRCGAHEAMCPRYAENPSWIHEMAEREGFEPSVSFPTHDFQSSTIDHSATSPYIMSANDLAAKQRRISRAAGCTPLGAGPLPPQSCG